MKKNGMKIFCITMLFMTFLMWIGFQMVLLTEGFEAHAVLLAQGTFWLLVVYMGFVFWYKI